MYPKRVTTCISEPGGLRHELPVLRHRSAGLTRNMSAAEIVEQVVDAKRMLRRGDLRRAAGTPAGAELGSEDDDSTTPPAVSGPTRISNVVFMGMGEALANYKAAIGAIRRLTDPAPDGLGIRARHRDVDRGAGARHRQACRGRASPSRRRSLHAPDDELRNELVPINTC